MLLGSRTLAGADRHDGQLGALGAALGTGGMLSLVYAITRFGDDGFTDTAAITLLTAAIVLLAAFTITQARSRNPLVPLELFRDRNRSGSYLTMLLLAVGPMGTLYILTLHLQEVEHYSPLQTGLAWLPFAAGIILGAGAAPKLLLRVSPRYTATFGALLSAAAALWLSSLSVGTSYWLHLAPGMFALALGFGIAVLALTQTAVNGVDSDKAGIASALLNSAQQIGVAFGLAVLAGVAATATTSAADAGTLADHALVAGHTAALTTAGGLLLTAAVLAFTTLNSYTAPEGRTPARAEHPTHAEN